jgi:hypothetical protein
MRTREQSRTIWLHRRAAPHKAAIRSRSCSM